MQLSRSRMFSRAGGFGVGGVIAFALCLCNPSPIHSLENAVTAESLESASSGSTAAPPTSNDWGRSALYAQRKTGPNAVGSKMKSAAKLGLDWLVRHQRKNGSWSSVESSTQCKNPSRPCKSPEIYKDTDYSGAYGYDPGVTSLALLAFLGRGNTHLQAEKSSYKRSVDKAVGWLLSEQIREDNESKRKGLIGDTQKKRQDGYMEPEGWIYNHAVATLALSELLLGSGDQERLAGPLKHAVEYLLRGQSKFGWNYGDDDGKSNTSSTMWCATALMTARHCVEAGLLEVEVKAIDGALARVHQWIEQAAGGKLFRIGYLAPGDPGSSTTGLEVNNKFPFEVLKCPSNTAAGLFFTWFHKREDLSESDKLWEFIGEYVPSWTPYSEEKTSTINYYYWYYGAHATFQKGGKVWQGWKTAIEETLLPNQRRSGCEKGSWDPVGAWCYHAGRVYSTAMALLALEAEYRVARK